MKLYEAIELGSSLVREDYGEYLKPEQGKVAGVLMGQPVSFRDQACGCLIGTAAFALGAKPMMDDEDRYDIGKRLYRTLMDVIPAASEPVSCPVFQNHAGKCGFQPVAQLLSVAEHLHQYHKWPRQKIAEWLKPIEDEYERQHPALDVENQVPERIES